MITQLLAHFAIDLCVAFLFYKIGFHEGHDEGYSEGEEFGRGKWYMTGYMDAKMSNKLDHETNDGSVLAVMDEVEDVDIGALGPDEARGG